MAGTGAALLIACNAIVGLDEDYTVDAGGLLPDGDDSASDGIAPPPEDGGDGSIDPGDATVDAEVPCPGTGGPNMVRVPAPDGGKSYCIDSTEVTELQYAAFIASDAGFRGTRPSACGWKNQPRAFLPDAGNSASLKCRWTPTMFADVPVTCVDWCDAYAFCQWAGKRLCGTVGGAAVPWNDSTENLSVERDEWYRACSGGMTGQDFPYGRGYDPGKCNDEESLLDMPVDVKTLVWCEGGYDGLFDMVGNAFEFENSCSGDAGPDNLCMVRGGSWAKKAGAPDNFSRCSGRGVLDKRSARFDDFGIRCCAD